MAIKVGINGFGGIGRHSESHPDIVAKAAYINSVRAWNMWLHSIFANPLNTMKLVIAMYVHTGLALKGDYTHKTSFRTHNNLIPRSVDYEIDPKLCFVIMPLGRSFNGVYFEIKETVESRGMKCLRADEIFGQDVLMDTIMIAIRRAIIVIADISLHNPNVFYEVGVAHTLGKKTILLWATGGDKIPFDLYHWQHIQYENTLNGGPDLRRKLGTAIDNIMKGITNWDYHGKGHIRRGAP